MFQSVGWRYPLIIAARIRKLLRQWIRKVVFFISRSGDDSLEWEDEDYWDDGYSATKVWSREKRALPDFGTRVELERRLNAEHLEVVRKLPVLQERERRLALRDVRSFRMPKSKGGDRRKAGASLQAYEEDDQLVRPRKPRHRRRRW